MAIDAAKPVLVNLIAAHHVDFAQPLFDCPGYDFSQQHPSGRAAAKGGVPGRVVNPELVARQEGEIGGSLCSIEGQESKMQLPKL